MKRLIFISSILFFLASPISQAAEPIGFIFSGDKISSVQNDREYVRVGERLPIVQLKKRFARYKVSSTAGEDCMVCASVSLRNISFGVDFDESGIVVTRISSSDKTASDALGNRVGASLRNAIGNVANCDAGDVTSCASTRLRGLWYVVREDSKCALKINGKGKETPIPACAKIDGFQIHRN